MTKDEALAEYAAAVLRTARWSNTYFNVMRCAVAAEGIEREKLDRRGASMRDMRTEYVDEEMRAAKALRHCILAEASS